MFGQNSLHWLMLGIVATLGTAVLFREFLESRFKVTLWIFSFDKISTDVFAEHLKDFDKNCYAFGRIGSKIYLTINCSRHSARILLDRFGNSCKTCLSIDNPVVGS